MSWAIFIQNAVNSHGMEQIRRLCGISQPTLERWISGRAEPQSSLQEVFRRDISELPPR